MSAKRTSANANIRDHIDTYIRDLLHRERVNLNHLMGMLSASDSRRFVTKPRITKLLGEREDLENNRGEWVKI